MDKDILKDYIDACAQVKETRQAILKLKKARRRHEQDAVKGSSHDFPYTAQTFRIEGVGYAAFRDPGAEDRLEVALQERLEKAELIKRDVETWLNGVPMRMQRIIRYRFFEEMQWSQVAKKITQSNAGGTIRSRPM